MLGNAFFQLNDQYQLGLDALESHPIVKRVTPHKRVIRTLKYVRGMCYVVGIYT